MKSVKEEIRNRAKHSSFFDTRDIIAEHLCRRFDVIWDQVCDNCQIPVMHLIQNHYDKRRDWIPS